MPLAFEGEDSQFPNDDERELQPEDSQLPNDGKRELQPEAVAVDALVVDDDDDDHTDSTDDDNTAYDDEVVAKSLKRKFELLGGCDYYDKREE